MHIFYSFAKRTACLLVVITHFSVCWTVKVINLTDEKITVDIHSTQAYLDRKATQQKCEFIGKQVNPNSFSDFNYKDVNPICVAPCTKSVTVTSPVKLTAKNTLTTCGNVIVIIRKDAVSKWKIEYHAWSTDFIKLLEERTRMPLPVKAIVDQFGDGSIQTLSVFRQPVQSGIKELSEIIMKNELKQLNYDTLYHTGFILKCQDKLIRLERNQTVSTAILIKQPEGKEGYEQRAVTLPRGIRFGEFISKAMDNDPNFWKYHPVNNNCQLFVLQCLEKNNIEVSNDLRTFIYQDAGKVLANSPLLKEISIAASSLANRINKIVEETTYVTIQNGTPYTLRVRMRYAGESVLLKSCTPIDFLLKSGSERSVSQGICLVEEIKVFASLKEVGSIQAIPYEQLQKAADIFTEKSFVGRGKLSANFLIRSVEAKKLMIEDLGQQRLSIGELQQLAAAAR